MAARLIALSGLCAALSACGPAGDGSSPDTGAETAPGPTAQQQALIAGLSAPFDQGD